MTFDSLLNASPSLFSAETSADDEALETDGATIDENVFAGLMMLASPVGIAAILTASLVLVTAFIIVCHGQICVRRRRRVKSSPVNHKQSSNKRQPAQQPQMTKRTSREPHSPVVVTPRLYHTAQHRHLTAWNYYGHVYPHYVTPVLPNADDDSTSSDSSSCRRHYNDYYYHSKRRKPKTLTPQQRRRATRQQSNPVYLSPDVLRAFDAQFKENQYVCCASQRLMLLDNNCPVSDLNRRSARRHRHSSSSNSKSRAKKRQRASEEQENFQAEAIVDVSELPTEITAGGIQLTDADSFPAAGNADINEQINNGSENVQ